MIQRTLSKTIMIDAGGNLRLASFFVIGVGSILGYAGFTTQTYPRQNDLAPLEGSDYATR